MDAVYARQQTSQSSTDERINRVQLLAIVCLLVIRILTILRHDKFPSNNSCCCLHRDRDPSLPELLPLCMLHLIGSFIIIVGCDGYCIDDILASAFSTTDDILASDICFEAVIADLNVFINKHH